MSERVKRLRSRMVTRGNQVCVEKYKIILDTEKEYSGQHAVIKRARTFANTLAKMPIIIQEDELLIGNPASKRWGLEIEAALGIWDQNEIDGLRVDGYRMDQEDADEMLRMNGEFKPFGMYEGANLAVREDERLENFVRTGICLAPWKAAKTGNRVGGGTACSGLGLGPGWMLLCIDYELPLKKGMLALIEECKEELKNNRFHNSLSYERSLTLQSMQLCLEATVLYANRCADAAELAAKTAATPERKKELLKMAENCRNVPAHPARNFWEAMQCVWFMMLTVSPSPTSALGRFDQYMYEYYKKDKESGAMTDADILELLGCLRIHVMELHQISGKEIRKRASGGARWYNMTIGGVKTDGSDATNELSYLVLDAIMDCPTIQPTVTVRVAKSTPNELVLKGIECQAKGLSMPAFVSDESYIKFFTSPSHGDNGLPLKIARNYCMTGCIDGNIPGKTRSLGISMFVAPLTLDIFMNHGKCKNTGVQAGNDCGDLDRFNTFDEFYKEYKKEFAYFIELAAEKNNIENIVFRDQTPDPFRSALMTDGIKVGLDATHRTFEFENSSLLNAVGVMNLAQSLFSIKKIVYEEKYITLNELKKVLDANWAGHEDLRQKCLALPYFGNDVDEVDEMVADLYAFWNKTGTAQPAAYGGYCRTNAISVTSHAPGGALTGATPDGRFAGETLADANASPIGGKDKKGPLAVFKSAMKIDQLDFQAFLFNMRFHPSALKTKDDMQKLVDALRIYLGNGGKMIQFNVVDSETLIDAKTNPLLHRDLMVRVAGYSAYFTNLTTNIQDEIINRTAHVKV